MPEVGRIYLEDDYGYVGMATYQVHPFARQAEVHAYGRVWMQVRTVGAGAWVYRARPGASLTQTAGLVDLVGLHDHGWIDPNAPPIVSAPVLEPVPEPPAVVVAAMPEPVVRRAVDPVAEMPRVSPHRRSYTAPPVAQPITVPEFPPLTALDGDGLTFPSDDLGVALGAVVVCLIVVVLILLGLAAWIA